MVAFHIYRRLLGAHLRAVLEYRTDALLTIAATVLGQIAGLMFVVVVFAQTTTLGGWSRAEVLCVCGLVILSEGIGSLFFEGTWLLGMLVNFGFLDYLLIRPYPVVLQVTGAAVGFNGLGNVVIGAGLLAAAGGGLELVWTPLLGLWAFVLIISGVLVKLSVSLASNAVVFWLLSPSSSLAASVHTMGELARYPLNVYGTALRSLLTVVPVAFVGYFPVAALLGKGVPAVVGALTPVVALACASLALIVFQAGVRRYESAGN
jgi:ABC-2 type transport system permease protein